MSGRHVIAIALCCGLGVAGCGNGHVATESSTVTATPSPIPSPTSSPTPSPRLPRSKLAAARRIRAAPRAAATEHDIELARRFVAFALNPTAATHAAVPLANEVRIGLSRDLSSTLDPPAAIQSESWVLKADYFRAYAGSFSALRLIKDHAEETGSPAVVGPTSGLEISVGDHPHCVSPPMPAPEGYGHLRRVSIQPTDESTDSCLMWFTVDLFVDRGQVAAVTLDVYEP